MPATSDEPCDVPTRQAVGALPGDAVRRFVEASGERGPHVPPRTVRIARRFHRLFSVKAGLRTVAVAGRLAADAVVRAEGDPDVVSLCEQPMRVLAPFGQGPHFTFDLGLVRREGTGTGTGAGAGAGAGGETLTVVAAAAGLETGPDGVQAPPHWSTLRAWCQRHGHRCAFVTDLEIDADRMPIRNWRALLGFVRLAREAPEPDLERRVHDTVRETPGLTLALLSRHVARADEQTLAAAVANLPHRGALDAELAARPFTPHAPLGATHRA